MGGLTWTLMELSLGLHLTVFVPFKDEEEEEEEFCIIKLRAGGEVN